MLWLGFAALALSWYLLDPEARPDLTAANADSVDQVAGAALDGLRSARR